MGLFTSLVSLFFSKVIIAIDVDASSCFLKIVRRKYGTIKEDVTKEFKVTDNKIPMDAIKLIYQYRKKYPFSYVVIMLKILAQGILLHRHNRKVIMGDLKLNECEIVTKDNLLFFAKKAMLKDFLRRYNNINGVDFLFSPFLLIHDHIKHFPTPGRNLYVLLQRSNITLMIAQGGKISFSSFFLVSSDVQNTSDDEYQTNSYFTNYDEIDDLSDFDSLSNLSLDHLKLDMFIPNFEKEDHKIIYYNDIPMAKTIAKTITDSLMEYYQNPLYGGTFIDKIIFLDACKINDDAFSLIARETMIESVKRDFDLLGALIQFARTEIGEKI